MSSRNGTHLHDCHRPFQPLSSLPYHPPKEYRQHERYEREQPQACRTPPTATWVRWTADVAIILERCDESPPRGNTEHEGYHYGRCLSKQSKACQTPISQIYSNDHLPRGHAERSSGAVAGSLRAQRLPPGPGPRVEGSHAKESRKESDIWHWVPEDWVSESLRTVTVHFSISRHARPEEWAALTSVAPHTKHRAISTPTMLNSHNASQIGSV